jgi:DNA-binding NarL/FixJ family response regulator
VKLKRKILVIEDDVELGRLINVLLTTNGFEYIHVRSGAEGIQKAFEEVPDLILCDIGMTPIDGYQVFKILSESSKTNKIPFIFISGKSEIEDIRFGLELGADDYIIKPFSNSTLINTITTRLSKYERLMNTGRDELDVMIDLVPNPVFISDGEQILRINKHFKNAFKHIDIESKKNNKVSMLFEPSGYSTLEQVLHKCANNLLDSYHGDIIVDLLGEFLPAKISITPTIKSTRNGNLIIMLVMNHSTPENHSPSVDNLCKVLRDYNIKVTPPLLTKLTTLYNNKSSDDLMVPAFRFSEREKEVLRLSCEGMPIKQIADRLCISDRTVEKHRSNLMAKTGSKNIVEVLVYAIKSNLIDV